MVDYRRLGIASSNAHRRTTFPPIQYFAIGLSSSSRVTFLLRIWHKFWTICLSISISIRSPSKVPLTLLPMKLWEKYVTWPGWRRLPQTAMIPIVCLITAELTGGFKASDGYVCEVNGWFLIPDSKPIKQRVDFTSSASAASIISGYELLSK